jgi:pyruvate dehydrogenase E1 component
MIEGAYWLVEPSFGAELAIIASGPVVQEALEAHERIAEDIPGAGLLVVTSADRLHRGWLHSRRAGVIHGRCYLEELLAPLSPRAGIVTILDGHSATMSWMGAVGRYDVLPLGVERFGQSGNIPDLYRAYGIDADAILDAVARLCLAS